MTPDLPLSFLAPLALVPAMLVALVRGGRRPGMLPALAEGSTLLALGLAVAGAVQLAVTGPSDGVTGLLRLDAVGATLVLLVAFIGWVVMRYGRRYLDGEAREGAFHGLMLATLAAVLVLVQAASLAVALGAFVAVGIGLRQLLLFYPGRAAARRAAAKFSLVWHAGDVALALAMALLWLSFGTTDLAALAAAVNDGGLPGLGQVAVALLVLAAALKTAAFPLHGWLTEVMEAPTPVSALLHAGIINGGGVLLIRTASLVQESPGAMAALVMLGGFTALFGAMVMLTQSAVKTALAWSTVAQMGFMLLQCGLGLWPLALLHILAHSLYKAHAFLSSGGAVQAVASIRRPGPVAVPGFSAVTRSFGLALVLYAVIAGISTMLFGAKSPQVLALGMVLILGVAYLVAQGMADAAPAELTLRTALLSAAAAVAHFAFQHLSYALWGAALPPAPVAGPLEWALIVLTLMSFGVVAVAQTLFPLWAHHPAAAGLRVHLANGLYLNAVLDRLIGGTRTTRTL